MRRALPGLLLVAMMACVDEVTSSNDLDNDGIPDSSDQCAGAPETFNGVFDGDGCPDTPVDLYFAVRSDVEQFWRRLFEQGLGLPYVPVRDFRLFQGTGQSACGLGQGPFYCGLDLSIYLDEVFMLDQLGRIGDFAPAAIIAHEFGHHAQFLLGILGTVPTIQSELQADCLAGAWASTAGARGLLDPGDLQEASVSLFQAGDAPGVPWFDPRAHGTGPQRQQAFGWGYVNGALAC